MSDQPARQVFTVTQPTGGPATLDFTTPGPFGDFAFAARFTDDTDHTFGTYHTAEHQLFIDVLDAGQRNDQPTKWQPRCVPVACSSPR